MKLDASYIISYRHYMVVLWLYLLDGLDVHAQVYIEQEQHRFNFAQSTIGYDFEYSPSSGRSYTLNDQNELMRIPINSSISPVFTITGLHFWGRAEFFTGFSLGSFSFKDANDENTFSRTGSTGAKYFLRQIRNNQLSPYVGMSVSTFSFKQHSGASMRRVDYPLLLGFTYSFRFGMLEIGCIYHYNNQYNYFIAKDRNVDIEIPNLSFSADFKYYIDFSMQSFEKKKSGRLQRIHQTMKDQGGLNSITIGIGPTYSFFIGSSSHNRVNYPFLDDHQISSLYPDVSIGYYSNAGDWTITSNWRAYKAELAAFGVKQQISRRSIALDFFKFFGDYHGFVPFIGGILSYERTKISERVANQVTADFQKNQLAPGVVIGWDIRPTRVDWWTIRTNIRYFPTFRVDMPGGEKINLSQIELNFLQFVVFPQRLSAHFKSK